MKTVSMKELARRINGELAKQGARLKRRAGRYCVETDSGLLVSDREDLAALGLELGVLRVVR